MGWWGYEVFDGDTPSEVKDDIFDILGVDSYERIETHEHNDVTVDAPISAAQLQAMFTVCSTNYNYSDLDRSAAMTVLAEFVLQNRVRLTQRQASIIRRPIQAELDNIETMGWCDENARKRVLRSFLRSFDRYVSQPSRSSRSRPTRASRATRGGSWRRFECRRDGSRKFWEIKAIRSSGYKVRWGRIGSSTPRELIKTSGSVIAAINSKLRKGYREV